MHGGFTPNSLQFLAIKMWGAPFPVAGRAAGGQNLASSGEDSEGLLAGCV